MHLVIQGADIETRDLKELAKLSGASAIDRLSATAFRLRGAKPADDIAALCSKARLDFGFVPEGRKLSDFRLLVMDMDSTLITMETIDELADMVNIKAEVARITERAMRGEIEYDQSLRERLAGRPRAALALQAHALASLVDVGPATVLPRACATTCFKKVIESCFK